jgi:hypothetical protein
MIAVILGAGFGIAERSRYVLRTGGTTTNESEALRMMPERKP